MDALAAAREAGDVNLYKKLLDEDPSMAVKVAHDMNMSRSTELHMAANEGRVAMCEALLDHGADVNARDSHDRSPLFTTLSVDVARVLLDRGAVQYVTRLGETPLDYAVNRAVYNDDAVPMCELLLSRHKYSREDMTRALCHVIRGCGWCKKDNRHVAQLLINYGAPTYARAVFKAEEEDEHDMYVTPLGRAVAKRDVAMCKFLLERGAAETMDTAIDVDMTATQRALSAKAADLIDVLRAHGAWRT